MDRPPPRLDDLITYVTEQHPAEDPLGRLSTAVLVGEHLADVADHLIGHFVDQARRAGASWTDIGRSMGVTKQAAQKRFVPRPDGSPLDAGDFGRFTDRARTVIVTAQEQARTARNDHIEPLHIALGLLAVPEGLAAHAIQACGVTLDQVRDAATARLGPAAGTIPAHIPFTGAGKKTMELTVREALRLGHNYVGTEHILLGLLSAEADEAATATLTALGVTHAAVEEWTLAKLDELRAARSL
ncbi:MAG TPA: Clp protease N-terminal domain-containing protein [Pseudonocardiaceae bacterium]